MGLVRLGSLTAKEQEAIAGCSAGSVVGPIKINAKQFHLLLVNKVHEANFDAAMRAQLLQELLDTWLSDAKQRSGVIISV